MAGNGAVLIVSLNSHEVLYGLWDTSTEDKESVWCALGSGVELSLSWGCHSCTYIIRAPEEAAAWGGFEVTSHSASLLWLSEDYWAPRVSVYPMLTPPPPHYPTAGQKRRKGGQGRRENANRHPARKNS